MKCPLKDKCTEYGKQGQLESENTIADLLVYMQALNDRAEINDVTDFRVLQGGYKLVDSVIATIEDLKHGGSETLQY
jgi:hypothetical protein